jgi:hypothetical protein
MAAAKPSAVANSPRATSASDAIKPATAFQSRQTGNRFLERLPVVH